MTDDKPMDNRRARYLIAAAVLFLVLLVGAVYLVIMAVRGDDTDTGPQSPAPEIVSRVPLGPGW